MPIPVYPWVSKAAGLGWGYFRFLDWLPLHPLVVIPRGVDVANLWRKAREWGQYRDALADWPQDLPVNPAYMNAPLYKRISRYTYIVSYEIQLEPGGEWEGREVATTTDEWLTPREVVGSWSDKVTRQAVISEYAVRNFALYQVDDMSLY